MTRSAPSSNREVRPRLARNLATVALGALGLAIAFLLFRAPSADPAAATGQGTAPAAAARDLDPETASSPRQPIQDARDGAAGVAQAPKARRGTPQALADEWGVRVAGVHLAAGGRLLNLRYEVLDPGKAGLIVDSESSRTYLLDEKTGTRLHVPSSSRSGSVRRGASDLRQGAAYSLQFPNPGGTLQAGSKVTVVMGGFRAAHLNVE